jgi:transcriptional antiterminator
MKKIKLSKQGEKLKELQKHLGVSDEDVRRMITVLIVSGFGKSAFAFLTQSGQEYSFTFDDIRAGMLNEGKIE